MNILWRHVEPCSDVITVQLSVWITVGAGHRRLYENPIVPKTLRSIKKTHSAFEKNNKKKKSINTPMSLKTNETRCSRMLLMGMQALS